MKSMFEGKEFLTMSYMVLAKNQNGIALASESKMVDFSFNTVDEDTKKIFCENNVLLGVTGVVLWEHSYLPSILFQILNENDFETACKMIIAEAKEFLSKIPFERFERPIYTNIVLCSRLCDYKTYIIEFENNILTNKTELERKDAEIRSFGLDKEFDEVSYGKFCFYSKNELVNYAVNQIENVMSNATEEDKKYIGGKVQIGWL